ncbi:MAG: hypothetical protein ACPG7F_21490, partial [Aggregatilineales bacterium]
FHTSSIIPNDEKPSVALRKGKHSSMRLAIDAVKHGKASAALAASLFHYNELRIGDLKQYLHEQGIPVRLHGWEILNDETA